MLHDEARRAAKAVARANCHKMTRWDNYGMCECEHCGAALVDTDAVDFVAFADVSRLGTFATPCDSAMRNTLSSSPTTAA